MSDLAKERELCCEDVCMYCSGNARGYLKARGPNSAGNWTHKNTSGVSEVLCKASAIRSRDRFLSHTPPKASYDG